MLKNLKTINKMKTAVEQFIEQLEQQGDSWENVSIGRMNISIKIEDYLKLIEQAKEMEKEEKLKIKIQCFKESLQFIDDNYMVELLNIRIYNMEQELETFKSE